ncbi:hypothetical protein IHE55_03975 [Streptomyces pactum]|uniref:Uncharacterized protein n=1 Tax=Streptomyces pactum TaxID=68249 RepID=A0ABS0NFP8_9ACTN|nr:hypothetical protein [Streptomyces pactum]MBH5334004.1 hypothetical protein [Streptomyces pactum]
MSPALGPDGPPGLPPGRNRPRSASGPTGLGDIDAAVPGTGAQVARARYSDHGIALTAP